MQVWLGIVISMICVIAVLYSIQWYLDRHSHQSLTSQQMSHRRILVGKHYLYVFGNLLTQGSVHLIIKLTLHFSWKIISNNKAVLARRNVYHFDWWLAFGPWPLSSSSRLTHRYYSPTSWRRSIARLSIPSTTYWIVMISSCSLEKDRQWIF
jgi:hypothetical protein